MMDTGALKGRNAIEEVGYLRGGFSVPSICSSTSYSFPRKKSLMRKAQFYVDVGLLPCQFFSIKKKNLYKCVSKYKKIHHRENISK